MAHELKFDATTGKILNEYLAEGKIVLIHPAVPCGGCYERNQHIRIGDYGLAGDGVSRFGNRNTKCEGCGGSGVIPIIIKVDKL